MIVTAIKAQIKNPDRVSIFVDGIYSFSLTLDQLLEQKLKKNDDISDQRISELKKLSEEGKLKARTLEWVLGRPHSTKEFRDYLYKKKADKELIEAWIEEFTEKKYLNDEQFARWFVENRQRKNKSTRAVSAELRTKGVSPQTIQSIVIELYGDNQEQDSLKLLVNKLRKKPRYHNEQKLKMYLVSKGFSYNDIKQVLSEADDEPRLVP